MAHQMWEYLVVEVQAFSRYTKEVYIETLGKRIVVPYAGTDALRRILNDFGAEGWELVDIDTSHKSYDDESEKARMELPWDRVCTFKRPT